MWLFALDILTGIIIVIAIATYIINNGDTKITVTTLKKSQKGEQEHKNNCQSKENARTLTHV